MSECGTENQIQRRTVQLQARKRERSRDVIDHIDLAGVQPGRQRRGRHVELEHGRLPIRGRQLVASTTGVSNARTRPRKNAMLVITLIGADVAPDAFAGSYTS